MSKTTALVVGFGLNLGFMSFYKDFLLRLRAKDQELNRMRFMAWSYQGDKKFEKDTMDHVVHNVECVSTRKGYKWGSGFFVKEGLDRMKEAQLANYVRYYKGVGNNKQEIKFGDRVFFDPRETPTDF